MTESSMMLRAPSGNVARMIIVSARTMWGPHAGGVGGAEPGAERH
jgi:hypothetical protein